MEEDKLNSMIEGIKGGEKEAKKEEEKKNITGVLKDLGMHLGGIRFQTVILLVKYIISEGLITGN